MSLGIHQPRLRNEGEIVIRRSTFAFSLLALGILFLGSIAGASAQGVPSLPSSFQARTITTSDGTKIYVRFGGTGPVVVLLHGYAENSDSWAPLAADLMKDHTVVVPDLRGIGRSSIPASGYDKKTQAGDVRAVITGLGYDRTFVVAHDIGNMVAYAYASMYPDKVERLVVMDAPIPGIGPWNQILLIPGVWHFNFHGPDAERLVAGRERIYFDRIWDDFSATPGEPNAATRDFFTASYTRPGGMRAGFAQFAAFSQDAKDNEVFEKTKLSMPVLAVGGEKSFGAMQAEIMRYVATNVQQAVILGSGHWLLEEQPAQTVAVVRKFLDASPEERLSATDYKFPDKGNLGTGSSGVAGIETIVLKGDPNQAGVYTIMLRVPAHTHIAPHSHRDDRVATVISGTWRIGYGEIFDESKLKALPPGSFYTEPPGQAHFAETGNEAVEVQITGYGPSSTDYVNPHDDPRTSEQPK